MTKYLLILFILQTHLFLLAQKVDSVADIDGNKYSVVKIGNQYWLGENLKVTRFNNGDTLSFVQGMAGYWIRKTCYNKFKTDSALANIYGYYYNRNAIFDKRGICPSGWHVPTNNEFDTLQASLKKIHENIFLSIKTRPRTDLRTADEKKDSPLWTGNNYNWILNIDKSLNVSNTDYFSKHGRSRFEAPPSGYYNSKTNTFVDFQMRTYYFTQTLINNDIEKVILRYIGNPQNTISEDNSLFNREMGYSCRCIMNN